ncbi:MAG: ribonuclease H-like domain-containing protein [Halobacteriales archaeon]|nr:ribonuclease H-like domain-containing protein [Halobacteriales archaeon]
MHDLYRTATRGFAFPTYSTSLKKVAPYMGFRWRGNDVNGMESIALFFAYVKDAVGNADKLQRVLAYNEDDCRATRVVKDWLAQQAGGQEHAGPRVRLLGAPRRRTPSRRTAAARATTRCVVRVSSGAERTRRRLRLVLHPRVRLRPAVRRCHPRVRCRGMRAVRSAYLDHNGEPPQRVLGSVRLRPCHRTLPGLPQCASSVTPGPPRGINASRSSCTSGTRPRVAAAR